MSPATDEKIKEKTGASGKNEGKSRRGSPVALEVPVSVAGARPATAHDKRELFTEETTTVVVFKDGAVIQLSAAISVGQLLFLTDKRSKREVVCQVVHKRNHRPTSCYVELEFTEDAENFWGVSFPDHEEITELPQAAQAVEAQEPTEDDRSEPIATPKTEDVEQLKSEVEALRAQLRALQDQRAEEVKKPAGDGDEQSRKLVEAEAAARAAVEASAEENAERMDREARERAERMAAKARQHLQAQNGDAKKPEVDLNAVLKSAPEPPVPHQSEAAKPLVDLDAAAKAAAEEKEKARKAAEAVAEGRAAAEEAAKQSQWAKDEESRKASEEARKWEQEAMEAERQRRREEQERREREQTGPGNGDPATEPGKTEPEKSDLPGRLNIGMKLPTMAPGAPGSAQDTPKVELAPEATANREKLDPIDELLPKPALDFSKAPKTADPNDPYNIYRPMRRRAGWLEIVAAGVLLVLLLVGGTYAWYKNRLPFFHRAPKAGTLAATDPKPVGGAKPAVVATPASNGPASVSGSTENSAAAAAASGTADGSAEVSASGGSTAGNATPVAPGAPETSPAPKNESPAPPVNVGKPAAPKGSESKASAKKDSGGKADTAKSGKKRGKAETSSESKPKPEETVVPSDAPVLPAKLVHAVPPVYPPDAMLNYITGDVRIEAVVDPKGHIGEMKILVGPAALRQAAMDALKQYEYEPATQGGKSVASKVTVTIKFWFDP